MLPPLNTSRRKDFAAAASIPPGLDTDDVQDLIDAEVGEPVFSKLTQSIQPSNGRLAYLYRHHATSGVENDGYLMATPAGGQFFALFSFMKVGAFSSHYLSRIGEGMPAVNTISNAAGVSAGGTWNSTAATDAYGGQYRSNSTAGSTLSASVVGHTLFLRLYGNTSGGLALVAIDGDYTAANRLPVVGATEVAAGWFTSADLGKRYVNCYHNGTDPDRQVCLAEGLTDGAHLITVKVQGTAVSGAVGTAVNVVAFAATTAATTPATSNATFLHTRYVINTVDTISSIVGVPQYTPSGFSNPQFLTEGHSLGEVMLTETWRVDGSNPSLAAGGLASGNAIFFDRQTRLDHPDHSDCCRRRVIHLCRTSDPLHLATRQTLTWQFAGTISSHYMAMMPLGVRKAQQTTAYDSAAFPRVRIGDRVGTIPTVGDGSFSFAQPSGMAAAYSPDHDTVAVLYVPDETAAFDDWVYSDGFYTSIQDRTDGADKIYMARSSSTTEAVTATTVHKWRTGYRVLRIEDAAVVLAA